MGCAVMLPVLEQCWYSADLALTLALFDLKCDCSCAVFQAGVTPVIVHFRSSCRIEVLPLVFHPLEERCRWDSLFVVTP